MAIVNIPGVGLVDNVTGKVKQTSKINPQIKKPPVTQTPNTVKPTQTIPGVGQVGQNGQVAVQAPNTSIPTSVVPKTNNVVNNKVVTPANTDFTGLPGGPNAQGNYANTAAGNINRVQDAKETVAYNKMKDSYTKAVGTYNQQLTDTQKQYQKSKHDATVQSDMQRLNFQQYLLARGAGSGAQAQAELQNSAGLMNTVGNLGVARDENLNKINQGKAQAKRDFVSGWNDYMTTSNANRQDALFNQQQAEAKARQDAAEKAAKAASDAADKNKPKDLTIAQQIARPGSVKSSISAQFGKGDKEVIENRNGKQYKTLTHSPQQQRKIWTFIMNPANQLTADQQWNMMKQYGMGAKADKNTGLLLGPKNLQLFIYNLKTTAPDKVMVAYLKKLGFKDEKGLSVDQQVNNILANKDRYGKQYLK